MTPRNRIPHPLGSLAACGGQLLLALGIKALWAAAALAADTTEAFDRGTVDLELYARYLGIGLADGQRDSSAESVIGYGLTDSLSVYLAFEHSRVSLPNPGQERAVLALQFTALDSDHVDFDLTGEAGALGEQGEEPLYGMAFELNLDREPDLAAWGAYLRAGGVHVRRKHTSAREEYAAVLGAYLTVAPAHQLLVEYDTAVLPSPDSGERPTEVGGVALGYNVALHPALELVTEVRGDIPQRGERGSASVLLGVIGALGP